jgi:hypothetical protein
MLSTIDVASVDVSPERAGGCSALLSILESLTTFDAIFVESVLNPYLAAHLQKRGYENVGADWQPNYVKTLPGRLS